MDRYFLALLVIILMSVQSVQPANAEIDARCNEEYIPLQERYETGLLFETIKCEEDWKPSYIFGTMHSDAKDLYPLLKPVLKVMKNVTSANFEVLENPDQTLEVVKLMYYSDFSFKTLQTVLDKRLYKKLQRTVRKYNKDMKERLYVKMRPWAVAVLLQYPKKENDGLYIDLKLEKHAQRNGLTKYGLETVHEQMKFFTDLSDEQSIGFLRDIINNFDKSEEMNKRLKRLYKLGDLTKMQEMADESLKIIRDVKLQKKFTNDLIIERNKRMFKRVKPRLKDGALVAVGALHLPWDYGLLQLFENDGFRVYPVVSAQ